MCAKSSLSICTDATCEVFREHVCAYSSEQRKTVTEDLIEITVVSRVQLKRERGQVRVDEYTRVQGIIQGVCVVIHSFWWRLTLASPATRDGGHTQRALGRPVCVCLLGCMGACLSSGKESLLCASACEKKGQKRWRIYRPSGCLASLNDLAPGRKCRRKNEKHVCHFFSCCQTATHTALKIIHTPCLDGSIFLSLGRQNSSIPLV